MKKILDNSLIVNYESHMKRLKQNIIAEKAQISDSYLSEIIANKKRPSWSTAKKLAKATGTSPVLWLEGSTDQIKLELLNTNPHR